MSTVHPTKVETSTVVARVVDVGTDLTLKIRVSCASGCDLRRGRVEILGPDGMPTTGALVEHQANTNETGKLVLKSPPEVGLHSWTVSFGEQTVGDVVHEESSLHLAIRSRPHTTSMAVWGLAAPVVTNAPFRLKVGVKCSAACKLTGQLVDVKDEAGSKICEARLGDAPWPGTRGLYVSEVSLVAPGQERIFPWSVAFSGDRLPLLHRGALETFSFRTAQPPEHCVTVKVIEPEAGKPLARVGVSMGAYRSSTDNGGVAKLGLPKGSYELHVRKRGYRASPKIVEVVKDIAVQIEASQVPQEDPDEEEMWM